MEVARDPQPLGLLGRERAAAALAPLRLEPVEHLVEGADDRDHLDAALLGEPLPRPQQVDRPHPLDEPVDGGERRPQQQEVGRQHHDEPDDEVERLHDRDRGVDPAGREREQEDSGEQQSRVDREDTPEER